VRKPTRKILERNEELGRGGKGTEIKTI